MWDILLDAFLDTLKIFPFIFVIYVLIELLEHKTTFTKDHQRLQGNLAPLMGAATGIIPQCGFSVMAAKLYDKGLIRTGTLLAVFLATSDEALINMLEDFGILEIAKTGTIAIERGRSTIYDNSKLREEYDYGKNVL